MAIVLYVMLPAVVTYVVWRAIAVSKVRWLVVPAVVLTISTASVMVLGIHIAVEEIRPGGGMNWFESHSTLLNQANLSLCLIAGLIIAYQAKIKSPRAADHVLGKMVFWWSCCILFWIAAMVVH